MKTSMHIALVSPSWPMTATPNGIVTYVGCLRAELIRQGHKVSIFSGIVSPENTDQHVHHVTAGLRTRLGRRISKWMGAGTPDVLAWGRCLAMAIRRAHRVDPIDIVEMEESFGWCGDVHRMLSIPLVVKLHGPAFLSLVEEELKTPFAALKIQAEGEALRQVRVITSPSRDTLARTMARYDLAPQLGEVVVNPMPLEGDFKSWTPECAERRTVLFVGRFDKLKGGDTLLLAYRCLLEMEPDVRLIFVGPDVGVTSADGSRVHLEEFCGRHFTPAQRARIDFRGYMSRADIFALRSEASVCVVASRRENQPYTVLEAMVQGCPVVAIDAGGVGEMIEHGVAGLLARPNDPNDLALQLRLVLNDRVLSQALGEAGRRYVTSVHAPAVVANRTLEVYGRAIRDSISEPLRRDAKVRALD